ncbi:hypothetical protein BH23GEM6_BH23GEM6_04270 [soil metagenome]
MRHATTLRGATLLTLILTAAPACDNVIWGGADIEIVPPPPAASMTPVPTDERVFAEYGLPRGQVIFHIVPSDQGSRLIPIGEISGDSVRTIRRPAGVAPEAYEGRFRDAVIPIGAQFDVFRRGARVGTFVAQRPGPVTQCGVPTVLGNTTVVAAASDIDQFISFRQGLAPAARGEFSPPQITGSIRTYASIIAERLILQNGLPRPRSWTGAQRDMQAVEIAAGGHPEMAATYLVGDSLAVGPADPQGYSVFYIADFETRRGYQPVYQEVHDYRQGGKAAPRLVDYLNWDGEGGEEILIEVFGTDQRWYEAISERNGRWTKIWEGERC